MPAETAYVSLAENVFFSKSVGTQRSYRQHCFLAPLWTLAGLSPALFVLLAPPASLHAGASGR